MNQMPIKNSFDISVETDQRTGEVIAVYFEFRKGRVKVTKELCDGDAFADYDSSGTLLGLEILAPCSGRVLTRIEGMEPESKRFLKEAAPRAMVTA
jgi:uncharacterized protein YuzE